MKHPDEIKLAMEMCTSAVCTNDNRCPYGKIDSGCADVMTEDGLAYIRQLESNASQVSKALCGKENATLDEILKAVGQIKSELEETKQRLDLKRRECEVHEHDKIVYMIRAKRYEGLYEGARDRRQDLP